MRVSLCGWQVTWRLKGNEKEGKARKKLPLTGARRLKGSEKEGKARKKLPLQVTWRLKGSEKEGKARKKLPLKVTSQPKGSEKEGNVTIQAPLPHIRISNTSCSFLAFSKGKNAHMGRGSPIRINVWKLKSLTCKHDDSLISYIDPE